MSYVIDDSFVGVYNLCLFIDIDDRVCGLTVHYGRFHKDNKLLVFLYISICRSPVSHPTFNDQSLLNTKPILIDIRVIYIQPRAVMTR